MKYIFVAGAPGSKWSSVVKNIYWSNDLDHTDYSEKRTYYHDASGSLDLMHLGAYFDPGMEFALPENISALNRQQLENIFDQPFSGPENKIKIIKSHLFSEYIDFLKATWPEVPIITVDRGDDACLGWWVKCGHFDITYPLYHDYYENLPKMAKIITKQNSGIQEALHKYPSLQVDNNVNLAMQLGIRIPSGEYYQDYQKSDVDVRIIK